MSAPQGGTAGAVGAGGSILGPIMQGVAGYRAGKYNAKVDENSAVAAQQQGAADEEKVASDARYAAGEAIAAQGASGLQIGTGTALDVLRENAINAGLDQLRIRTHAESARRGYVAKAAQDRAAGRDALVAGFLTAAENGAKAFAGGG